LLAVLAAGWLADRYSPRWVIAVGATGTGIPGLIFAGFADGDTPRIPTRPADVRRRDASGGTVTNASIPVGG
jgi:hypothetical protein